MSYAEWLDLQRLLQEARSSEEMLSQRNKQLLQDSEIAQCESQALGIDLMRAQEAKETLSAEVVSQVRSKVCCEDFSTWNSFSNAT